MLENRVRETSATTGLTDFVLLGTPDDTFKTFAAALGDGNTCFYTAVNSDTPEMETGIGTVVAPSTLQRTTILESTNGGNKVNFSAGTKTIILALPKQIFTTTPTPHYIPKADASGKIDAGWIPANAGDSITGTANPTLQSLVVWEDENTIRDAPGWVMQDDDKLLGTACYSAINDVAYAASIELDLNVSNVHRFTLSGNPTLTIANASLNQRFALCIVGDSGTSVTWWSNITWMEGGVPTLITAADEQNWFGFIVTGVDGYGNPTYAGFIMAAAYNDTIEALGLLDADIGFIKQTDATATTFEKVGSTGTGDVVLATSPTLVTPNIGVATAATLNGVTFTGSGTLATGTSTLTLTGDSTINQDVTTTGTPQFDKLGVGAASISSQGVRVITATTGATTQAGVLFQVTGDSGATTAVRGCYGEAKTAASSFTCTTVSSYWAQRATAGSGSTITNCIGYDCDIQTAGGTLNASFRGVNTAAAGRWNLYMSGNAANYLAGGLQIGHTGTALAGFESRSTTAQIAASYDASNYATITVASNGATTFDAVGAGAAFTFSDGVQVTSLGVGVAANSTAAIIVSKNTTDPSATQFLLNLGSTANTITANNANAIVGINSDVRMNQAGFNYTAALGLRATNNAAYATGSSGTVTTAIACANGVANTGAGTLTNGTALFVGTALNSGGGTFTTNTGLEISAQTVGTNIYGIRSRIASSSGRYNLYIDGTADNYFNGLITCTSSITSTGTGGVGYATGAGGTVTQVTSRTTGVTLNKVCGCVTLVSAAGSASWQSFTVTNSTVAATDVIVVNQKSGTDLYMIHVTNVAAGSFHVTFATTGGTTTEQPVFNFSVIKAVMA